MKVLDHVMPRAKTWELWTAVSALIHVKTGKEETVREERHLQRALYNFDGLWKPSKKFGAGVYITISKTKK